MRYKVTHVVHLTYEVRGPCTRESFTALQQSQRARLNLSSRWVQGEMSKRHLALTSCGALKTTSLVLFIPSICAREACRISFACAPTTHSHHVVAWCLASQAVLYLARTQAFVGRIDPSHVLALNVALRPGHRGWWFLNWSNETLCVSFLMFPAYVTLRASVTVNSPSARQPGTASLCWAWVWTPTQCFGAGVVHSLEAWQLSPLLAAWASPSGPGPSAASPSGPGPSAASPSGPGPSSGPSALRRPSSAQPALLLFVKGHPTISSLDLETGTTTKHGNFPL